MLIYKEKLSIDLEEDIDKKRSKTIREIKRYYYKFTKISFVRWKNTNG